MCSYSGQWFQASLWYEQPRCPNKKNKRDGLENAFVYMLENNLLNVFFPFKSFDFRNVLGLKSVSGSN